jgi:proteasome accessory factor B
MSELAALYFGRNLMSFLGGSPFAQDLESAFEKIREALPERSLPYLSRVQEIFAARPDPRKDYSGKQEVIASVIDAILHERRARIDYYSFSSRRAKSYTVEPYKVVYHHGGLYLFARAEESAEVRTFAVERIRRIEVLDQTFEIPADFSVAEHSRSAFGIMGGKPETVELRFDGDAVAYIRERVWHESQELEEAADGSLRVRLQVAPGRELKSWIKGYLPDVEVLSPARLRREIADEVERAGQRLAAPVKRR